MRIYVFCIYVCAHIVPRPDDDDGEQEEEEEEEEDDDAELSCNMSWNENIEIQELEICT